MFIHEKRGEDALNANASVLKDFSGTAVHDCWSPYFNFTQARHVLCGAHLLPMLYKMPRPLADSEQALPHYPPDS